MEVASQTNAVHLSMRQREAEEKKGLQVNLSMESMRSQSEYVLKMQMEKTRSELKTELAKILVNLSDRELEYLLVDQV